MTLLPLLERLDLPTEVQGAAAAAREYWSGDNDDVRVLVDAKSACWAYLDNFEPGRDVATADGRHVRALLCVLEPDGGDDDVAMTAEWFAEMLSSE